MGRKGKRSQQNPQEVSGRVGSCALYKRSGGFCISYNYGVISGSKMIQNGIPQYFLENWKLKMGDKHSDID